MNIVPYKEWILLTIYIASTSQKTYYAKTIKRSRLILFREIIVLYFENRRENLYTLRGQMQSLQVLKAVVTTLF
jgi:hypothetical protein